MIPSYAYWPRTATSRTVRNDYMFVRNQPKKLMPHVAPPRGERVFNYLFVRSENSDLYSAVSPRSNRAPRSDWRSA